jgi:pyridoxal biosynthesis lyase PdxS
VVREKDDGFFVGTGTFDFRDLSFAEAIVFHVRTYHNLIEISRI